MDGEILNTNDVTYSNNHSLDTSRAFTHRCSYWNWTYNGLS